MCVIRKYSFLDFDHFLFPLLLFILNLFIFFPLFLNIILGTSTCFLFGLFSFILLLLLLILPQLFICHFLDLLFFFFPFFFFLITSLLILLFFLGLFLLNIIKILSNELIPFIVTHLVEHVLDLFIIKYTVWIFIIFIDQIPIKIELFFLIFFDFDFLFLFLLLLIVLVLFLFLVLNDRKNQDQ